MFRVYTSKYQIHTPHITFECRICQTGLPELLPFNMPCLFSDDAYLQTT